MRGAFSESKLIHTHWRVYRTDNISQPKSQWITVKTTHSVSFWTGPTSIRVTYIMFSVKQLYTLLDFNMHILSMVSNSVLLWLASAAKCAAELTVVGCNYSTILLFKYSGSLIFLSYLIHCTIWWYMGKNHIWITEHVKYGISVEITTKNVTTQKEGTGARVSIKIW